MIFPQNTHKSPLSDLRRKSETLSIPTRRAPVRGQEVGKVGKDHWALGLRNTTLLCGYFSPAQSLISYPSAKTLHGSCATFTDAETMESHQAPHKTPL